MYLKCKNCSYRSLEINNPYGIPDKLVPKIIRMHQMTNKNHKVEVVKND